MSILLTMPKGARTEHRGCQERYGKEVKIHKWHCHTFDHTPRNDTTLNYVLPDSKVANHCNIVGYDGKDCRGKVVFGKRESSSLLLTSFERS